MFKNLTQNSWGFYVSNIDGVAVSTGGYGTHLNNAASINTVSAYTQLLSGSNVAYDCFWVTICLNNCYVSANAIKTLVTIGIDPTGGTSYTDIIPNLACGGAGTIEGGTNSAPWYSFPIYIPAGASVAAKYQTNNLTAAPYCIIILTGQPSHPEMLQYGYSVEAIGANTSTSGGVSVTTNYAWNSLGTTSNDCFFWQIGMSVNDSTMGTGSVISDLSYTGTGSNYQVIMSQIAQPDATERIFFTSENTYNYVPSGQTLYIRSDVSATANGSFDFIAYGVKC